MPTTMSGDTEQSDAAVPSVVVEDSEALCPVADGVESPFICSSEDWMPFSEGLRDSGCGPSPDEGRTSEEEEARGYMNLRHKCNRNRIEGRTRPKRETARNMCRPLKQWLYAHRDLPYPNKGEKLDLAAKSKMTITQVSNWFANARRRLKKTVSSSQPGPLSWERRIKLYNRNVVGNQERLSISSDDSDDDDDDEQELDDEPHASGSVYGDEIDFVSYETASNTNSLPSSPTTKPNSSTSSGNYSSSSSSGVGGEKDALAAQGDHCPGKFKQGIMQRYLSDAYRVNLREGGSLVDVMRMRNASGSLSSQDYEEEEEEELSTGSSPRSTPVKEQQAEDNLEKSDVYRAGYESCLEDSEENDLHTKELSAVLVLMQFAASKRNLSPKVIFRR